MPDSPDVPPSRPTTPSVADGPRHPPAGDGPGGGGAGHEGGEYGWLTPQQVARALGISVRQVYRLVDRGVLPAYRIGGAIRLLAEDVDAFRRNQSRDGDG
jgi:excisionase family DNA binding protein